MTEGSLSGTKVLVVDDDFYLADNTREALEEAGAVVLGPYGHEEDALRSLDGQVPHYAILDLNLGSGPSFAVARNLRMRGVPMVLVTGYDQGVVPPDLADTTCLQKPVAMAALLAALRALIGQPAREDTA